MKWNQVRRIINNSITLGTKLNTRKSKNREVICICKNGFKVSIGKKNTIFVDWKVLEKCWQHLNKCKKYEVSFFKSTYMYKNIYKKHPCLVHVIEQIFVKAGLATPANKRIYYKSYPGFVVSACIGGSYGIRVGVQNAHNYFSRRWRCIDVIINGQHYCFSLSNTFWTTCPEFRGKPIGTWLQQRNMATWPKGHPPKFTMIPLKGNRFIIL